MSENPRQFLCMNWGDAYGADYVNRLYSMVSRHVSNPFRFVCYTDNREGIRDEVECFDCPEVDIPSPKRNRGWRKISLWARELPGLSGTVLFLDLDIVVTGSLDDFFLYKPESEFCVIHNWTQPDRRIGNTSAYRFEVGSHPEILQRLLTSHQTVLAEFPNSQTYVSSCLASSIQFWPETWCRSFKRHCVPNKLLRWWIAPHLPSDARLVAFPGRPNPHEAAAGIWPAPWYKKIYKHIRPAVWVQQHWR
ncbi:MAG: hypothetical protein R3C20_14530 [Planctomycetaceae bacterium]